MATPKVGDRLMNDAGTLVEIVKDVEGDTLEPGTFPESRADELIKAGYRAVAKDDVIPKQAHEL